MTVLVKSPAEVKKQPTFCKGELVKSTAANGNIYFVTGAGETPRHFAGVRISGKGPFAEYGKEYIRDAVELFEGEVVISND
jgi:hypothetical protein